VFLYCEMAATRARFLLGLGVAVLRVSACAILLGGLAAGPAVAVPVTADEIAMTHKWVAERLDGDSPHFPFSFKYGGKPSERLLKEWTRKVDVRKLDDQRTERTVRFTDPQSGLEVRCVVVEYGDFPTVEWTLHFKNTGATDTPILENIRALDMELARTGQDEFLLHHGQGARSGRSDYAPLETRLEPGVARRFAPTGGRPANGAWPYFNVQWGSQGMIVVVGWPGQWLAEFVRDADRGIRIRAGQERTRFRLRPGEEVRSPRIVLQFWKGRDWIESQNIWRRWMMAHNMPRPGGKLPPPITLGSSYRVHHEMTRANEENQIMFIDRYLEERIHIDYWWMDAGWYPCGGEWHRTGTWEPDPKRFPRGLKPISDHAHANGIKTLLWFEAERVTQGTWLAEHHPEWLLGGVLHNLGNPDARQWLTDHVDGLLTEQGIDLYRQDFNMDPLDHWRKNDAEDRQGITEIKYVTGYLAFWDALRRRHPNMLIDSCASGGRRNELEAMRRSVPLWRSDHAYEPVAMQCLTYGISLWLPYYGTGNGAYYDPLPAYLDPSAGPHTTPVDPYAFWSDCAPANGFVFDMRARDIDYDAVRRLTRQRREMVANYYGDYYPLTPYDLSESVWVAWQFHRPECDEGVVQAFRRAACSGKSARFKLRGLDPDRVYVLTDLETKESANHSGCKLMETGLTVLISTKPGASVLTYRAAR
ncbi:MAG: alpha-galactosidase, partial [Pirellulales bacterium]